MTDIRIGHGYDVHKLGENRALIIGGVNIPHSLGLIGHSDADVLLHALSDALLGALALGDIGKLFPDNDNAYLGIDSRILLRRVYDHICQQGYRISNVDCTIIAQAPKLAPHIPLMRANIAQDLCIDTSRVSVKATTEESLGFTGRREGISAHSVCILYKS